MFDHICTSCFGSFQSLNREADKCENCRMIDDGYLSKQVKIHQDYCQGMAEIFLAGGATTPKEEE